MKFAIPFLLLLVCNSIHAQKEIQWPGGKTSAIVLTYDDALQSQLTFAVPQLAAYQLKGTFFLDGRMKEAEMEGWRNAAKAGHEMANHSVYHPCSEKAYKADHYAENYTVDSMVNEIGVMNKRLSAIDGAKLRTYAYPCGASLAGGVEYTPALKKSGYIKYARAGSDRNATIVTDFTTLDFFKVPAWGLAANTTAEALISLVKDNQQAGGMAVFMFHGVGGDYLNVSAGAHEALLGYLNQHRNEIWVATFQEVLDYVKQQTAMAQPVQAQPEQQNLYMPQVYFPGQEDSIAKGFKLAVATMVFNRSVIQDGLLAQPEVCLVAGFDYPTVWTRDGALNTWNAAAALMPGVALNTLRSLIATAPDGKTYISGEYWDCMLFAIGSWEYYLNTGDKVFLRQSFEASLHTAEVLEKNEWDGSMHLFRGPPFFQDGISGYPTLYSNTGVYEGKDWVSNIKKWVQVNPELRAQWGFGLPMFALSTNCIYYKALSILPLMAKELGIKLKEDYQAKAGLLKQAINDRFWMPEKNTYRYMIDPNGNSDRQESAGLALAILFDIADNAKCSLLFKNTYVAPSGIPCVYPSFERYTGPGKDQYARHSGTVWPQVQGLWALAAAKKGATSLFYHELLALTHNVMRDKQFREIYHPLTGVPYGGMQEDNTGKVVLTESMCMQTWSASAFWAMVVKGAFGISLQDNGLSFAPLPPRGSKRYVLKNYRYRNSFLNIEVLGDGNNIKEFRINGQLQQEPVLPLNSSGILNIVIKMGN
jgi:peptidoglycan/xylan/chitin deacetylase (PgdA/CDA1 family)